MAQSKFIYLGIKGSVIAVNPATGQEIWARKLKGSDFVNVALGGNNLLAATRGELFCLDPLNGIVRWHNPLPGYGWGLVSMAGSDISASAWNTLAAEKRRQEEEADSSSAATT